MGELRRLYYQTKERKPFKRYMWRWDGIWSGSVFQMSRITVGNIPRPYTYINGYCSRGSNAANNDLPENMVKSDSLLSTYDKWCRVSINGSAYGWIIFDIGSSEIVDSYTLMTGGDTASNTGRNPKRVRLYGTNVDATSGDDDSWELLSDQNVGLPAANHANWTTSTKEFITSTRYLLAPSDISRGSGLRIQVQATLFYSGQSFSDTGNFALPSIVNSQNLKYIAFHFNCKTYAQYNGGKLGSAMLDNNTTTTYYTQTTYSFSTYSSSMVRLNFRGYYIDYTTGQTNTSNNEELKIIVDTETLEGRFYRSGEYKTSKTMPYAPTDIARVRLTDVPGSLTNLAAAGFASLEEAEAWDGSPF